MPLFGQDAKLEYAEKYKEIAIEQMESSGIPASITLAQGILESDCGRSYLATEGNNHFGIKCHNWDGESLRRDDDLKDECFRKYETVEESFQDHSDFLRFRDRYKELFLYDITDYKSWAYGLQNAGYATNPKYARTLIRIIEECNLYRYDTVSSISSIPPPLINIEKDTLYKGKSATFSIEREIFERNGVPYVIANGIDSYNSLAKEIGLFKREILRYNDVKENRKIPSGTIVYLERKKNSGAKYFDKHIVEEGETLYSISQRYAIKIEQLCKYNKLSLRSNLKIGDVILLREYKNEQEDQKEQKRFNWKEWFKKR